MRSRVGSFVVAVALSAGPARALADETDNVPSADPAAEARRRYNLGIQAYSSKRFVEAALDFEAAAFQKPHAVTLYTAALAWEQANQSERAADDFARALEVAGLSTQQAGNARERLAALEGMLGTLAVSGGEGWRVQLDAFTEVAAPARLHATAGVHSLVARLPSGAIHRRDVLVEAGQTRKIELDEAMFAPAFAKEAPAIAGAHVAVAAPLAPPAAPRVVERDEPHGVLRTTLGVASIGVGATTALGAVVLGTQALGARDAYDAAPTRDGLDHARALETWTTVAWVAGGVFVAGGVALVLWPSSSARAGAPSPADAKDDARVVLAPTLGGLLARGSF